MELTSMSARIFAPKRAIFREQTICGFILPFPTIYFPPVAPYSAMAPNGFRIFTTMKKCGLQIMRISLTG